MRQAPTLKPLPQLRRHAWLTGTRAWIAGLGLVGVLLVGLIAHDTVFASPAGVTIRTATATVQSTQSPLTTAQVAQLQHQVTAAQQNYNDTVASVNATNQADAATVLNDQAKVNADCPNGAQCSQERAQLASDQSKQHMD